MSNNYEYVRSVAMAINGPHEVMPPRSKYTLNELRSVRWSLLNAQQQSVLMRQAKAAILQAGITYRNKEGEFPARGLVS